MSRPGAGTGRSLLSRAAVALLPPGRFLYRPQASSLSLLRYGLGLEDRAPEDLSAAGQAAQFAPLAWRRLQREGRQVAVPERIHRLSASITARLARLQGLLGALDQEGLPVLLLKGLPLALYVYRDPSVRPMADFDLLVPPERFPSARQVLEGLGFVPRLPAPPGMAAAPGHVDHSLAYHLPGVLEVDLHYFALDECRWPGADQGFWERSTRRRGMGAWARVPSRTDLLLHVLAHGYRVQRGAPRWVADAGAILLDPSEAVDWALLVEETCRRRLVLPVGAALRYLRDQVGLPVPAEPLARLEEAPVAAWEPFDLWVRAATSLDGRVRRLFLAAVDYLRYQERPTLVGFGDYLAVRWAVEGGARGLVRELARRAWAVVRGVTPQQLAEEPEGQRPFS